MQTEKLQDVLSSAALPDEFYVTLQSLLETASIPKGEYFLRKGEVCKYIGFVQKGFLEGRHHKADKVFVNWFWKEYDFVVGIRSFLRQQPAYMSIKAVEQADLFLLSFDNLQLLYEQYPMFNLVVRRQLEDVIIDMAEMAPNLRIYSSRERYELLLQQHPEILQRSSLKSIASYLGVTQETLSRIRRPR